MEYFTELGYLGLFLSAFLAATILPLSSEIVLSALLLSKLSPVILVFVATIGNVLGSLVNYALGYWTNSVAIKKWIGVSSESLESAEQRFQKYGLFSLCFAWVPIIGDPLTIAAGVLKIRLLWFITLVTVGKFLRYVVLSYLVLNVN